jgi:hypothetical protein
MGREQGDDQAQTDSDASDVAEVQELIESWGDEISAKGLTDEQWDSLHQSRSREEGGTK